MSIRETAVYSVDRNHTPLRLTILISFFVFAFIVYLVTSLVVSSSGLNLVAILAAFVGGYLFSSLLERFLQNRWQSGRRVEITPEKVALVKKSNVEIEVPTEGEVGTALFWTFVIKRRSHVPKGWSLLAIALQPAHQDRYLTIYSLISPKDLKTFPNRDLFKEVIGNKEAQKQDQQESLRGDLRMAGEQRRLRQAENDRWINGAEMNLEDFTQYVEQIKTLFPEWLPLQ